MHGGRNPSYGTLPGNMMSHATALSEQRRLYRQLLDRYQSLYRETHAQLAQERQLIDELRKRSSALGDPIGAVHERLRQALALARSCAKLEDKITADAYVAHDDFALLAADYMKHKHGGTFIFDAVEAIDPQDKTTAYGRQMFTNRHRYYNAFLRKTLAYTDVRFCTSQPLADYLTVKHGLEFIVLPNYWPEPRAASRQSTIRAECGHTAEDFLICYVNNIYPASRFEDVLAALSLCDPAWKLVCVGKIFPEGDRKRLTYIALRHGLSDRVHFLPPMLDDGYLDYISGCDAALIWLDDQNVNCRLNLHNRYLDALRAGLPILSSSNCAFAQLNREHGIGLIASGRSAPALAKYMMALRDERDKLLRGMERARGVLRWEMVAERFCQALSGCRSVTFLTTKNPVRNRRLRLQVETLRARGIEVFGIGNFKPAEVSPELGTWFNMRSIAPRR